MENNTINTNLENRFDVEEITNSNSDIEVNNIIQKIVEQIVIKEKINIR